jgi:protein gp37
MGNSSIQWTDATWNPVTGCVKVSPGCKNCYAERVFPRAYASHRVPINASAGITDRDADPANNEHFRQRKFTDVVCHDSRLEQPLHWRTPRKIFVNSMSDLFHETVRDTFIADVFAVMAMAPQHTFQILTKRADRMKDWMDTGAGWMTAALNFRDRELGGFAYPWPLPNVWMGVSVENQEYADKRIPLLLQTPAAVRFVSYEPALGPVNFRSISVPAPHPGGIKDRDVVLYWDALSGFRASSMYSGTDNNPKLDWIIIGGESSNKARPFNINWARSVVRQGAASKVACFVKQLGSKPYACRESVKGLPDHAGCIKEGLCIGNIDDPDRVPQKWGKGGDMSQWPEDLQVRQFPEVRQ